MDREAVQICRRAFIPRHRLLPIIGWHPAVWRIGKTRTFGPAIDTGAFAGVDGALFDGGQSSW